MNIREFIRTRKQLIILLVILSVTEFLLGMLAFCTRRSDEWVTLRGTAENVKTYCEQRNGSMMSGRISQQNNEITWEVLPAGDLNLNAGQLARLNEKKELRLHENGNFTLYQSLEGRTSYLKVSDEKFRALNFMIPVNIAITVLNTLLLICLVISYLNQRRKKP